MSAPWVIASCFALSCLLTHVVRRLALRHGVMDLPSGRSSHTVPTPRGGGLAIVVTIVAAAVSVAVLVPGAAGPVGTVMVPASAVAVLGLLDDRFDLSARLRLIVQGAAAVLCLAAIAMTVAPSQSPASPLVLAFCLLAILWCTNLYNFMDGIDGIAGVEGVFVGLAAAALLAGQESHGISELLLATAGACGGFLVWNWQPARIFMGDVGSATLGFMFGGVAALTWMTGLMSPWVWVILLGAFVVDATVTLLVRWRRGARVSQAHRSHAYQRLARRLGSHRGAVGWLVALNVFWLLPFAALAHRWPAHAPWLTLVALGPLAVAAFGSGAGRPDDAR